MSNSIATFKWNTMKLNLLQRNAILGLAKMAYAIDAKAHDNAPVGVYPPASGRTGGALQSSIRVDESDKNGGTFYVLAGGTAGSYNVAYARRREFENNLHPNKKHYVRNAFKDVTKNYPKYFKGITK